MADDDISISGPFGFWSFPLLSTLLRGSMSANGNSLGGNVTAGQSSNPARVKERAQVIRDEDGNIQEVIVMEE